MADTDAPLAYDPSNLPPQAQTGLPAMAADLGDIAPAPTPEQSLLQAAYGDTGAQQYAALQQAGAAAPQQVQVPQLIDMTNAASPPGPQQVGGSQLDQLAGSLFAGLQTGDPNAGIKLSAAHQAQQLRVNEEYRRNASEFYTALVPAAFKQFPGRPDLAAVFLAHQARTRGLVVDPAVLLSINQKISDGMLTERDLDSIISDPTTPVATIERLGQSAKSLDALAKGRAEANEAVSKATTAAPAAQESLRATKLANDMKQLDVDSFYDSVEKRVTKEATDRGYQPGTRQFTDYIENRKNQITAATKRTALEQTPLSGREEDDFLQADRAGKFASEALKLLNDPTVAGNRGVLEGRLRLAARRLGFSQGEMENVYQSIASVSSLLASKIYSGGIRNMKWIDRVLEHTAQPGDEPALLKDKFNVILRAAREQQQGILNIHGRAATTLEPTVPEVTLPNEAGGTPAPGALSTQGQAYLDSLAPEGGAPPAP